MQQGKGLLGNGHRDQRYQTFGELKRDVSDHLTSRHEVVPKDGQAEVSRQRCQGGLDAWEFLREPRGLCPEVAESAEAEDAVRVVAKYVVPAGQQVVGFN